MVWVDVCMWMIDVGCVVNVFDCVVVEVEYVWFDWVSLLVVLLILMIGCENFFVGVVEDELLVEVESIVVLVMWLEW